MYDHNPFREAKKLMQESDFIKQVNYVMDPIFKKYGGGKLPDNPADQNKKSMIDALKRKREEHQAMVHRGELTQAEFDRMEKNGEFDIKEGTYDNFNECVEFYMDAKDYDRKSAENECRNGNHTFSEAYYGDPAFQELAQQDPREFASGEEEYEAEEKAHSAKEHVKRFVSKHASTNPQAAEVMKHINNAEIKDHDENTSIVRAGNISFAVDHKTGKVTTVS